MHYSQTMELTDVNHMDQTVAHKPRVDQVDCTQSDSYPQPLSILSRFFLDQAKGSFGSRIE
eukprot:gene6338-4565_t